MGTRCGSPYTAAVEENTSRWQHRVEHRVDEVRRAGDVGLGEAGRVGHRDARRLLRREVQHRVEGAAPWNTAASDSGSRTSPCSRSTPSGEVLLPAALEVVEHHRLVPLLGEREDDVAADVTGAAGDEDPHGGNLRGRLTESLVCPWLRTAQGVALWAELTTGDFPSGCEELSGRQRVNNGTRARREFETPRSECPP